MRFSLVVVIAATLYLFGRTQEVFHEDDYFVTKAVMEKQVGFSTRTPVDSAFSATSLEYLHDVDTVVGLAELLLAFHPMDIRPATTHSLKREHLTRFTSSRMRSNYRPLRRGILAHALSLVSLPLLSIPWQSLAIVGGDDVDNAEAAAVGAVGIYINLDGCQVCRKGVPGTCSGTLIAPNLVLTARHCLDVPLELNGTLDKIVFDTNISRPSAQSRKIDSFVSTADYGINADGNDLLLIKFKGMAPEPWEPVDLPLRLLPTKAEEKEAEKRGSPFFPSGIGFPEVVSYGYGLTDGRGESDPTKYSTGILKRITLQIETEVRPWGAGFLTKPAKRGSGTCSGDSGGGAILGLADPKGGNVRRVLVGMEAACAKPCKDNQAIFINPQNFSYFIEKGSRDLGSSLPPSLSWRDYL